MGKAAKSVTKAVTKPFGSIGGGITDFLLGKEIKPDAIAGDIRGAQAYGIQQAIKGSKALEEELAKPADEIIKKQQEAATKSALTAAQDARRKAQQVMAQRGLAGSSLGLSSDRSITQALGKQLGDIQAATPALLRQQRLSDAAARMSAGTGIFGMTGGAGVNFGGGRSGGLLGIAGAVAPIAGSIGGMMAGGPAGGAAGGAMGSAASNAITQYQNPNLRSGTMVG
jgi:hypothetical protein